MPETGRPTPVSRVNNIADHEMSPREQRTIAERLRGGPRRGVNGPLLASLDAPELADRAAALGTYLRFGFGLPLDLIEIAVLATAATWRSALVFDSHAPLACTSGIEPGDIDSIRRGRRPQHLTDTQRAALDLITAAPVDQAVDDHTGARMHALFTDAEMANLIAIAGYSGDGRHDGQRLPDRHHRRPAHRPLRSPPPRVAQKGNIMSRLDFPQSIDDAPEASQPALRAIDAQLGFTPNSFKLMAISPATLSGVLALQGGLAKTVDARTRDVVALAVSQANECVYCLSAHSHVAASVNNATDEEIASARLGHSEDPKRDAAGTFARRVVEERGSVTDADLAVMRAAGYTDRQIVELVALSVQFLLTNFLNNVAQTDVDFPPVALPT